MKAAHLRIIRSLARSNAPTRLLELDREAQQTADERAAILTMFPGLETQHDISKIEKMIKERKNKIGKHTRTKAERKAISARMKAYWQKKREMKAKRGKKKPQTIKID